MGGPHLAKEPLPQEHLVPVGNILCTGAEHGLGRPQGGGAEPSTKPHKVPGQSSRMALFTGEKKPCSRGNPQSSES